MIHIFKCIGAPVLLMLLSINLKAQTGTITSSIEVDAPIFISGVSGFDNELSLSGEPQETETVFFCVLDGQNEVIDSIEGDYDGNYFQSLTNPGFMQAMKTKS